MLITLTLIPENSLLRWVHCKTIMQVNIRVTLHNPNEIRLRPPLWKLFVRYIRKNSKDANAAVV